MPGPRKRTQSTVGSTRPGSSGGRTMEPPKHAFQVIVLGSSGGPREDVVSGLLVRSTAMNWAKGSAVAVDAGTLLAGINRTLEQAEFVEKERKLEVTKGPFTGLMLPNKAVLANAAFVFRELIGAILITHPHLDHIAALALNTPAIEAQSGPQKVAALPSAIAALKNHVFNDILWPNLSDEEGGAGLVTYQRLVDGGNLRLGRGEGRGYVKVCEGLLTKCMSISHGACKQRYNPDTGRHHRTESGVFSPEQFGLAARRRSSLDPLEARRTSQSHPSNSTPVPSNPTLATVESSAFFLRDQDSEAEIIVFGDIEPDSLSLEPRNGQVWEAAAPKIVAGTLRAMFIECSFSDAVEDAFLYGHLCPRHLIAELEALANKVVIYKNSSEASQETRKRRRESTTAERIEQLSPKTTSKDSSSVKKRKTEELQTETTTTVQTSASKEGGDQNGPSTHDGVPSYGVTDSATLAGLKVFLIHVKDGLSDAGSPRGRILKELEEHKQKSGLACEFIAPECGEWAFI